MTRKAACHCGQLRLEVTGEPQDVTICNCLACQRRTGSAFGVQAGFNAGQVQIAGRSSEFARTSEEPDQRVGIFHFCPDCGSTVFCTAEAEPDRIVVMAGTFADPSFPSPTESGYDNSRHPWVGLPDTIQRHIPGLWDAVHPLYQAGRYGEAADRGAQLIAAHPDQGYLYYNVACCESLAGRTEAAIGHLGQAIEMSDFAAEMAAGDSDFDPIRDEAAFQALLAAT